MRKISRLAIACGSHHDLPGDGTARYRVAAGAGGNHIVSSKKQCFIDEGRSNVTIRPAAI